MEKSWKKLQESMGNATWILWEEVYENHENSLEKSEGKVIGNCKTMGNERERS